MKIKHIKAQNNISENDIFYNIKDMVIVGSISSAVLANNAISTIRNFLNNDGYEEGKDFIIYKNVLYVHKSIANSDLKKRIAKYFYKNNVDVSYFGPNSSKELVGDLQSNHLDIPDWKVVILPNSFYASMEIENIVGWLDSKGYLKGEDFEYDKEVIYVNKSIKNHSYNNLINDISEFLQNNGILPNGKIVKVVNVYSPLADYSNIDFVKIMTPKPGVPVWDGVNEFLSENGIKDIDYYLSEGGKIININRLSKEYRYLLDLLKEFLNKKNIKEPLPNPVSISAPRGKDWRKVEFIGSDSNIKIRTVIEKIIKELKLRAFNENEVFCLIGDSFFANIRSDKFIYLFKALFLFTSDDSYNISEFFINYNIGRKEKPDIYRHWRNNIPDAFNTVNHSLRKSKFLFDLSGSESNEERILRISASENCIRNLLKKDIYNFFASTDGYFTYYNSVEHQVMESVTAFENDLMISFNNLKKAKTKEDRDAIVRNKVGDKDLIKIYNEENKSSSNLIDFWKSKNNPFRFLFPIDSNLFNILNKRFIFDEKKDNNFFENISDLDKVNYIRGLIIEINLIPCYDNRDINPEDVSNNSKYFTQLANSRKINVGNKILEVGYDLYEYLLSKNNFNCPRVNAFLDEFRYNIMAKKDSDENLEEYLFEVCIESIFNYSLDNMRNNIVFAPIPGDDDETKRREIKYREFLSKSNGDEVFGRIRKGFLDLYGKSGIKMRDFKTLISFKMSPMYKEMLRIISTELSKVMIDVKVHE